MSNSSSGPAGAPHDRALSRRGFLGVGAGAAGALLLSACGSDSSGGTTTAPAKAPTGGGKSIRILDDNTNKLFNEQLFAEFTKETGVKVVQYDQANFNDLHDRLATAFRAQDATYDVVMTWAAWSAEFGRAQWLEPLPHSVVPADLLPAALDAVSWDGVVYGLPKFASAQTMFYNKRLFEEAGLDPDQPPATWDDFVAAAHKLTKPGQYGFACDMGNTDGAYQNFIRTMLLDGGAFYGPGNKPTFNNAQGVDALQRLAGLLRTEKVMNPSSLQITNSSDLATLFAAGKTGIVFNWPSQWATATGSDSKLKASNIGNAVLPGITVPTASIDGSEGFAINRYSKNKAAALEWLKFVTRPSVQRRMVTQEGWFPVSQSLIEDPAIAKVLPPVKTYGEQGKYEIKRYGSPWYSKVVDDLSASITNVMLGKAQPKQALDQSAQNAADVISQYS